MSEVYLERETYMTHAQDSRCGKDTGTNRIATIIGKSKRWFKWRIAAVVRRANVNTEILRTLKSIDERLSMLENCVKKNDRSYGARNYIITGHWND